jgi:hypothetical protein
VRTGARVELCKWLWYRPASDSYLKTRKTGEPLWASPVVGLRSWL